MVEICDNDPTSSVEFSAVVAIASPREGAQPLLGMRLKHGGAGAHDLAAFASEIAGHTHLGKTTVWWGKLGSGDERTLTRSLARAVHIEDEQAVALMIDQAAEELARDAVLAEVVGELLAQGFQAGWVNIG